MPNAPISIFISYSRTDSVFVDRLDADLQARGFRTWVDRRKIEGGQYWMDELQKAIDRCQVVLLVLSPEAIASRYVSMEYQEAFSEHKVLIPLDYRPCPKVPMVLNGIQWVNFKGSYEQGLKDVLIALSRIEISALPPPKPTTTQNMHDIATHLNIQAPNLVVPQPALPPPDPNLNNLYLAGVDARAQGDLERTATFWQQVLDRKPDFENGTLALQMKALLTELHPIRVQRLRDQAEQAHHNGQWGQEIGAWQALLGLQPKDRQAKERIPIAEHNQKYAWLYENAQHFAVERNIPAAQTQLTMPWHDAPYYADPAGLAPSLGVLVPPSYEDTKQAKKRKETRLSFILAFTVFPLFFACSGGSLAASIGKVGSLTTWETMFFGIFSGFFTGFFFILFLVVLQLQKSRK